MINDYLARLKKTPCKYFDESVSRQIYCSTINPTCKFGNKCHYAHIHPATDRPYEFASAELDAIKKRNLDRRRARQRSAEWDWTAVLVPGLMSILLLISCILPIPGHGL